MICYVADNYYIVHVLSAGAKQAKEHVGKVPSLESLDLGFPEDDAENENDGLFFFIPNCTFFLQHLRFCTINAIMG